MSIRFDRVVDVRDLPFEDWFTSKDGKTLHELKKRIERQTYGGVTKPVEIPVVLVTPEQQEAYKKSGYARYVYVEFPQYSLLWNSPLLTEQELHHLPKLTEDEAVIEHSEQT